MNMDKYSKKQRFPLRSKSPEPQAVPRYILAIDPKMRRAFSVEAQLIPSSTENKGQSSSFRPKKELNPKAKVCAWLKTFEDDDEELSQSVRDSSRPSLVPIQPISTSHSQGELETLNQLRGKPIPPIRSSKSVDTGAEVIDDNNAPSEKESSASGADSINSSRATIDTNTSITNILSGQTQDENNYQTKEAEDDDGPDPEQFKKDFIIHVKEASTPADNTDKDRQNEIIKKLFRRKMSSQNPDEPKKTTEGGGDSAGLSFGGIANTLLQWKLNKARAVKRRSQSIAIDARHFALMGAIADKVKTELPRSLIQSLKEEAHPILAETVQGYKSEIGKSHRLTIQAQKRFDELTEELRHLH